MVTQLRSLLYGFEAKYGGLTKDPIEASSALMQGLIYGILLTQGKPEVADAILADVKKEIGLHGDADYVALMWVEAGEIANKMNSREEEW